MKEVSDEKKTKEPQGFSADEVGASRWGWQKDQSAKNRQSEKLVPGLPPIKTKLPENNNDTKYR